MTSQNSCVTGAFTLGAAGEYELERRVAGGAETTLETPFELTFDLVTPLP